VAAGIESSGVPSVHLDARQVILTDDRHSRATPLYWQTYARLRRAIPRLSPQGVIVMGGFIGATEHGATTTLGRGGSDLTATLVGAGIAADEIQIWKDVDGMLTCDPRVCSAGFRLTSLSYDEAAAMARAGAKILHPESVQPAIRQRIPIVLRNSRRPETGGTRISAAAEQCANPVKSIACKQNLTILEIRSRDSQSSASIVASLRQLCERQGTQAEFVGQTGDVIYFGIKSSDRFDDLHTELERCVEVRLRPNVAMISLIGSAPSARARSALRDIRQVAMASNGEGLALSLIVAQADLKRSVELLHREFFRQVDPAIFAAVHAETPVAIPGTHEPAAPVSREQRVRLLLTLPFSR
jgi:aspartate kinase